MRRQMLILVVLIAIGRLLPVWAHGNRSPEQPVAAATVTVQDADQPHNGDDGRQGDDHDDDQGDHDGQGGNDDGEHDDDGDEGDHDTDTDHDEDHDTDEDTDEDADHDTNNNSGGYGGHETYHSNYSFYGQVRWAGARTVVGNRELVGQDPWLPFLVPGMRLEVRGKVVGGNIQAAHVVIRSPAVWSYYQGPLSLVGGGEGWARVWFEASGSEARPFYQKPLEPAGGPVQVLACYTPAGWQALPAGVEPNVTPPRPGWWLLEGTWRGGRLLGWRIAKRLPGGCGRRGMAQR